MNKDLKYYMALPYTVILKPDEEGDYIARIGELDDCIAHGSTPQEALTNLEEVKSLWITDYLESGDPIPEAETETLPSGKWVQRVPRSLHRKLIALAKQDNVSLNQLVSNALSEVVGIRKAKAANTEIAKTESPTWGNMAHFNNVTFSIDQTAWQGRPMFRQAFRLIHNCIPEGKLEQNEEARKEKHATSRR